MRTISLMHPVTEFRLCFTCGHIAKYAEHTLPSCRCRRCGSADTRKMQDKWQSIREAIVKWCDARVDYGR